MTKAELDALRRLRKLASLEPAGFGVHDKLIKEETRLYLDSWVLPIIDDMIAKHAHRLEGAPRPSGWSSVTKDYSYFAVPPRQSDENKGNKVLK